MAAEALVCVLYYYGRMLQIICRLLLDESIEDLLDHVNDTVNVGLLLELELE